LQAPRARPADQPTIRSKVLHPKRLNGGHGIGGLPFHRWGFLLRYVGRTTQRNQQRAISQTGPVQQFSLPPSRCWWPLGRILFFFAGFLTWSLATRRRAELVNPIQPAGSARDGDFQYEHGKRPVEIKDPLDALARPRGRGRLTIPAKAGQAIAAREERELGPASQSGAFSRRFPDVVAIHAQAVDPVLPTS
jgi:hypothetical protein